VGSVAALTSGRTIVGAAAGGVTTGADEVVAGTDEVFGTADVIVAGGATWITGAASCAIDGVEPSARTAEIAAVALSERVNVCVMQTKMRRLGQSYTVMGSILDEVKRIVR
jgi:hypothetical protein